MVNASDLGLAFMWGIISAVSLPLGVFVGFIKRPSHKIRAALMAFGGGALFFALSVELFGEMICHSTLHYTKKELLASGFTMAASAVLGGLLFEFMNKQLNERGAFLRSISTKLRYVRKIRYGLGLKVFQNLKNFHLLRGLSDEDILYLIPFMQKEKYDEGDVIFFDIDSHTPIYFIVSGKVIMTTEVASKEDELEKTELVYNKDEFFGELQLVTGESKKATATAAEKTQVLSIQRKDLENLITKVRPLQTKIDTIRGNPSYAPFMPHQDKEIELVTHSDAPTSPLRSSSESISLQADDVTSIPEDEIKIPDNVISMADAEEIAEESVEKHSNVAFSIWLGILIDGIPESVVIGALTTSPSGMSFAFVFGVFLANFPEALSSSVIMREQGLSKLKVLLLWSSICLMTGIGALIGAAIFTGEPEGAAYYVTKGIEGLAGGAMLVMISKTMLPEAFELGEEVTGLATLAGFLSALIVRISS